MKNVIKKTLILIVIAFIIYNLVWFVNYKRYIDFSNLTGKDEFGNSLFIDDEKISYSVGFPHYLGFTGNLAICSLRNDKLQNGDVMVDIIIWPLPFSDKCEIGISLEVIEDTTLDETGFNYTTDCIEIMVDKDLNPLEEYTDDQIALLEENRDTIVKYLDKADGLWEIF